MSETTSRRPLKSREAPWARRAAAALASGGVSPDLVSALSIAFAALGAALMLIAAGQRFASLKSLLFLAAALGVQLRLLCNLMDGMIAVEHGRGSSAGPIWNELPDRIADALLLVGAGYAAATMGMFFAAGLGWLCAALAVLTAYVRELGHGLGFPADFSGPMAKPHRMAALTLTCLVAAIEPLWDWRGQAMTIGLTIIAALTAFTVGRRTAHLARGLGGPR